MYKNTKLIIMNKTNPPILIIALFLRSSISDISLILFNLRAVAFNSAIEVDDDVSRPDPPCLLVGRVIYRWSVLIYKTINYRVIINA
ncbi:hypothetical protein P186_0305 [Pyrobaculum ferrireducens]|uniref:Uncharacterized protein n=1 Tax=Pyrobaculum ferrireducens TaxID=1104324 RepID=G7VFV3_9CREN|nr:hypothetical protein P186_0305 [Pyrobaculum ferrireducens]